MPRRTSSSHYWSSMDFGSEDEERQATSARVYVDPWDLENYAFMRRHLEGDRDTSPPSAFEDARSLLGTLQRTLPSADSPTLFAGIDELDFSNDHFEVSSPYEIRDRKRIYGEKPATITTDTLSSLSSGNENCVYTTEDMCDPTSPDASLVYVYETTRRKRKIALPKRKPSHQEARVPFPEKFRRIRNIECLECKLLENAGYIDNYEMDLHTVPAKYMIKPPPGNFGLSSYGHLKIDYSCSWHSLDRLIKNSER